eukprot:6017829-Alexandrium_andersonii.AAC.1
MDVRARVEDRRKGSEHLGRPCGSKTLAPEHVSDDRRGPGQAFLALRAWMLRRWQGNGGRFLQRACRARGGGGLLPCRRTSRSAAAWQLCARAHSLTLGVGLLVLCARLE